MTVARYVKASLSTLPSARFAVGYCAAAGVHYFPLFSPLDCVFVLVDSSLTHQTPNGPSFKIAPLAVRLSPRRSSFDGRLADNNHTLGPVRT